MAPPVRPNITSPQMTVGKTESDLMCLSIHATHSNAVCWRTVTLKRHSQSCNCGQNATAFILAKKFRTESKFPAFLLHGLILINPNCYYYYYYYYYIIYALWIAYYLIKVSLNLKFVEHNLQNTQCLPVCHFWQIFHTLCLGTVLTIRLPVTKFQMFSSNSIFSYDQADSLLLSV